MGRFINPFTDVGFKRIFGQTVNKDLLIDFLNNLLEGEKQISDISFLDKELLPEFQGDRGAIYDIYCTTEAGEEFIVEMQNCEQAYIRERAIYYLCRAMSRQGERGANWKFNLKAVYGIFFLNFEMKDSEGKFRTDVWLSDRDMHVPFSDKLRFVFLQLPCFKKEESECDNDFERWIYVLKNMETLQRLPFKARKSVFEKLEQIVDIASLSKEERMKYDESIKVYRDQLATLDFAEQKGEAKGFVRGHAQGLTEGRAKGREEGREEGRAEGMLDVARRMKAMSIPVETISLATGLSLEEITKL